MKITTLVDRSICPDLFTASSVVLDLGADYGAFANAAANRFRCTVYAVEASPQIFAKMPAGDLVKKFNVAICERSGVVGAEIEAFNSCSDAFLRSIDQITVEFHEWVGGSSKTEVMDILHRLQALVFFALKLSPTNFSDVSFVHRRHMSFIDYASTIVGTWGPRIFRYAQRQLVRGKWQVLISKLRRGTLRLLPVTAWPDS